LVDFQELGVNTSSGTLGGTRSFNMIIIGEVDEGNYILIEEDKLKEDQQKEYVEVVERECLKSYSTTRSGDVIKKFDFPSFQPLTETQREN
jgi:hypothetical protein